ncbi:hypothetical protein KR215_006610 [Drosophila sulfurigaster]|nr:hypothetical protein KR215_006610 [Drosophila sulfurigaster]
MKLFTDLIFGLILIFLYVYHKWSKARNKRLVEENKNIKEMVEEVEESIPILKKDASTQTEREPKEMKEMSIQTDDDDDERIGLRQFRLIKASLTAIQAGLLMAESSAYRNLKPKELDGFNIKRTLAEICLLENRNRKFNDKMEE